MDKRSILAGVLALALLALVMQGSSKPRPAGPEEMPIGLDWNAKPIKPPESSSAAAAALAAENAATQRKERGGGGPADPSVERYGGASGSASGPRAAGGSSSDASIEQLPDGGALRRSGRGGGRGGAAAVQSPDAAELAGLPPAPSKPSSSLPALPDSSQQATASATYDPLGNQFGGAQHNWFFLKRPLRLLVLQLDADSSVVTSLALANLRGTTTVVTPPNVNLAGAGRHWTQIKLARASRARPTCHPWAIPRELQQLEFDLLYLQFPRKGGETKDVRMLFLAADVIAASRTKALTDEVDVIFSRCSAAGAETGSSSPQSWGGRQVGASQPYQPTTLFTCREAKDDGNSMCATRYVIRRDTLMGRYRNTRFNCIPSDLRSDFRWLKDVSRVVPPPQPRTRVREAYATVIHSSDRYLCGAIMLAQSLKLTNTTKDIVAIVTTGVSSLARQALREAGFKLFVRERVRSPSRSSYSEWNFSRLQLWSLPYDKVVFVDSDIVVLKNMDHLFRYPGVSARSNTHPTIDNPKLNSGFLVLEPMPCMLKDMLQKKDLVLTKKGDDQSFLQAYFPIWSMISPNYNFYKIRGEATGLHRKIDLVYGLHFFGRKPWRCPTIDSDCQPSYKLDYQSHEAHRLWWKFWDKWSSNLQEFCPSPEEQR